MSGATFTQGSTMRHVVVMTATSSVGLMALFFVDAINLFYISLLGVTELASAIGFAGTIQFFMISISIGFLIAGSATVSKAIGQGDRARARRLSSTSLITAVLALAGISALVWIWRGEALSLLGAKGASHALASGFLAIALPSVPLIGIGMACSGTLRAVGEARQAMYVTLGGGLAAAILDPILIFGLDLGLTGAAIAIVLTRIIIAAIGLWLVIRHHDMLARLSFAEWIADLRPVLAIAGPAMATQLSTPFGNAYLTNTVAEFGDSAVAGWAVLGRMTALAFGGIYAVAGAVGPIIGQNYGAGLWSRIASTYRDGLIFVACYVLVAWAALALAASYVVNGFGLDGAGAEIVRAFMTYAAGGFIFTGALFVSNAAFNNLGRPLWSTMCNWSRDAAVIPVMALLLAGGLGATGAVWIQASSAALVGTGAAILGWRAVHRIAARDAPPAPDIPPTPAFATARAAVLVGTSDHQERADPLASAKETR